MIVLFVMIGMFGIEI